MCAPGAVTGRSSAPVRLHLTFCAATGVQWTQWALHAPWKLGAWDGVASHPRGNPHLENPKDSLKDIITDVI